MSDTSEILKHFVLEPPYHVLTHFMKVEEAYTVHYKFNIWENVYQFVFEDTFPECCERLSWGMTRDGEDVNVQSVPGITCVESFDIKYECRMGERGDPVSRAVLQFNFVDKSDLRIWFANETSGPYAHRYNLKKNGETVHSHAI